MDLDDPRVAGAVPIVKAVAYEYRLGDLSDRVDDGMWALVEAAQRFDEDRGVPFGAYVATMARHRIIDGYRSRHGSRHVEVVMTWFPWAQGRLDVDEPSADAIARGDVEGAALAAVELAEVLDELGRLDERHRRAVVDRVNLVAIKETAAALGVTESRVSQLRRDALRMLR